MWPPPPSPQPELSGWLWSCSMLRDLLLSIMMMKTLMCWWWWCCWWWCWGRRRGCGYGCKVDDVGGVCAMVLVSAQVRQVLLDPTNHHQFGREHIAHSTEHLAPNTRNTSLCTPLNSLTHHLTPLHSFTGPCNCRLGIDIPSYILHLVAGVSIFLWVVG